MDLPRLLEDVRREIAHLRALEQSLERLQLLQETRSPHTIQMMLVLPSASLSGQRSGGRKCVHRRKYIFFRQ